MSAHRLVAKLHHTEEQAPLEERAHNKKEIVER